MFSRKNRILEWLGVVDRATAVLSSLAWATFLSNLLALVVFLAPNLGETDFLRLHYTTRLGVDWVSDWWKVFAYPGLALTAFVVNGYLAGRLVRQHRHLGFLAHAVGAAVQLLFAAVTVVVIMINRT